MTALAIGLAGINGVLEVETFADGVAFNDFVAHLGGAMLLRLSVCFRDGKVPNGERQWGLSQCNGAMVGLESESESESGLWNDNDAS
jgi:hypothetical protein